MDSKRRLMELHVWNLPHFSSLESTEKLLYWFMICHCDNVGVYHHNQKLATFQIGEAPDLDSFLANMNFDKPRIDQIDNNLFWIKDFIRDTWVTIAAGNNLGLSCYKLLVKHSLLDRFVQEYPNSINVTSFQEYVSGNKKGYNCLPLPQTYPKPEAEQRQVNGKSGTINTPINSNDKIHTNTPVVESSLEFEMRSKGILDHTPFKYRV